MWRGRTFVLCLLAAVVVPVAAAQYQSFAIKASVGGLPAGSDGASVAAFLPKHSSRILDFNVCFYTGFGSLQPITPSVYTHSSSGANIAFDVPASTIQEVPPASFAHGSFDALLYTVPADMTTCTGAAQALGNQAAITLNYPRLTAISITSTQQRNPNLSRVLPSKMSLSGAYFVGNTASSGASSVTFTSSITVTGNVSFISSTSLVSTIPIDIPQDATSVTVAVCNTAKYSYCSAGLPLAMTTLQANSGTVTAKPDPATSSQDVTLSARFSPPAITVAGAPSGSVTFEDAGSIIGVVPLVLDTAAKLHSAPPRSFAVRASPLKPIVADFNGDGIPDVLFIESGSPSGDAHPAFVHLLLGTTPAGDFEKDIAFKDFGKSSCGTILSAAAADFNNDGYADLALLCDNGPNSLPAEVLYTLLSRGDGTFSIGSNPKAPVYGSRILAGDFNRDGSPDLAVLGKLNAGGDTGVQILTGDGTGSFSLGQATTGLATDPGSTSSENYYDLAAADFNGDGYLDIAVMNAVTSDGSATGYVAFFENDKAGGFISASTTVPAAVAEHPQLLVAPLRRGDLPSVIVSLAGAEPLSVQTSTNPGRSDIEFEPPVATLVPGLLKTATGDFNGDGLLDLAVAENLDNLEYVLNGDGLGHFKRSYFDMKVNMTAAPNLLQAADENGDGYADLLAGWLVDPPSGGTIQNLRSFLAAGGAVTSLPPRKFASGAHSITATMGGNFAILGATAQTTLTITDSHTTLTLTTLPLASAPYGTNAVQLRAEIPDSTATGMVSFLSGSTLLGTAALVGSVHADATFIPALLPAGSYSFTAVYSGDPNHASATSPSVPFQITPVSPAITWHPSPSTIAFGTPLGGAQLDAISSVPGTFTYTPSLGTVLSAGVQTLSVLFTPNDGVDYTSVHGSVTVTVSQAIPVVSWPTPIDIAAGTSLSDTQLDATVIGVDGSALPGTFIYTPAGGTVLPLGTHTLSVLFTPTDVVDYQSVSTSVSIKVVTVLLTSISPSTALLGDDDKTITVTGAGFVSTAVVQMNGIPVATNFIDRRTLTAIVPAADFISVQTLLVSVFEAAQGLTSNALPFTVTAPAATVRVTGPTSVSPDSQPIYDFKIDPYPVHLNAMFTLSFEPSNGLPNDPTVVFSNGLQDLTVVVPRNTTDIPVQFQSGTIAGTLTLTPALEAGGAVITPASVQPLTIQAPTAVPGITSTRLVRDGNLLTVVTRGYSNTRLMTMAKFHFTAAPGKSLRTNDLTVDVASLFANWYASPESIQYGSQFTYTQTFNLSTDAEAVGNVTVTLSNDIGESPEATTP